VLRWRLFHNFRRLVLCDWVFLLDYHWYGRSCFGFVERVICGQRRFFQCQ
jgi:hypothetical protein